MEGVIVGEVMKIIPLLLFISVAFAAPACPSYPYRDYVDANAYQSPVKPADNLISSCNLNLNPICLFSNLLNTTEDKRLFISEDLAKNSFQNISNWNSNLSFGKWFNNTKSSANIKDVYYWKNNHQKMSELSLKSSNYDKITSQKRFEKVS
jgi:hypothetical protein